MTKMKVLYQTNIPSPYRVDFFNELGKEVDLTVLFERSGASDRKSSWIQEDFRYFKGIYLQGVKVAMDSAFCPGVIKYLTGQYDQIILGGYNTPTNMIAIEYMRYKKIPFILNADGGFIRRDYYLKYFIKKHLVSSASYWICSGIYTKNYLAYYGACPERTFVYPFTSLYKSDIFDSVLSREEKLRLREKLGIVTPKMIVSVGQFIYRKGFDLLLEAVKDLKDTTTCIIGGSPTSEYKDIISKYKMKNVVFPGFFSKERLREYYRAADIFVLPTREDIWGLVVNEAMACGLPVITTDKCVAGLELIENGVNGFIVESEKSTQLADRILRILGMQGYGIEMGSNNLAKVTDYNIENMSNKYIHILKENIFRD